MNEQTPDVAPERDEAMHGAREDGAVWCSVAEAAERLGVNRSTVTRLLKSRQLQGQLQDRRWRVSPESISKYIQYGGGFVPDPVSCVRGAMPDQAKSPHSRGWLLVYFPLVALPIALLTLRAYSPLSSIVSSSRVVGANPAPLIGTDAKGLPKVSLVPRKLDLTKREMLLEATIRIPGGTSALVPTNFGGRKLITCPSYPPFYPCQLSQELDTARIALFATANGNSAVVSDKSSGGIALHDSQAQSLVASDTLASLTIPIAGQGQDFPEDSYTGSAILSMAIVGDQWFPQSIPIPAHYSCCPQSSDPSFDASPNVQPFRGPPTHILGETSDQVVVSITLHRSGFTIAYLYFLALVPLAFSGLLLWAVVRSKEGDSPEQFLVGSVTATLAILPLRLVLVPNDVTGITRVDLLLAAGFLGLVGVGVAKYLMWR